jgi:hypothetical protein
VTITRVKINGITVNLSAIEYAVAIYHGRNDVTSLPTPSAAAFTTIGSTILGAIGDDLIIDAYSEARFTGKITDITIEHFHTTDGSPFARIQYAATGNLADLGLLQVGTAGYVLESLADRVDAIFTETGLAYTALTDPYTILNPVAANNGTSALQLLNDLGVQTGGTMYDTPAGDIVWESYTRRGYTYNPANWAALTEPWSSYDYDWDNVYIAASSAPTPVTLPNNGVVWEPIWKNNNQTILNAVTVTFDDTNPQDTVYYEDLVSQAAYGYRAYTLTTSLADGTDAYNRATNIITAQSVPRYDLSNIQVRVDLLSDPLRAEVLALVMGSRVLLNDLPQPSPASDYLGIVEGWGEQYVNGTHTLTLSLSDPRYSYAMATWGSVDNALIWGDVNASIQWYNVVLPEDLAA